MPKRSKWAKKQLVDFLVLCYQDKIPPHTIQDRMLEHLVTDNSFHPAISYSIDGNNDGKREPYNWEDVFASIANT